MCNAQRLYAGVTTPALDGADPTQACGERPILAALLLKKFDYAVERRVEPPRRAGLE
jgi:hypothetical protein